jgi:phage shock protein C
VLGGVCAGVARSAGLDPLLLRVVVVAVTVLTGGAGLLAYLAAWVLIPRETDADAPAAPPRAVPGPGVADSDAGSPVRTAWTSAGNDLKTLVAELRRPAPGPAENDAPTSGTADPGPTRGSTGDIDRPDGGVEPDADSAAEQPAAQAETPPPGPGIPAPRSPLAAVDDAATALGERLRTPEVQAGARKAAASVSQALNASVDELGRRIRRDPG